MTQYQVQFVLPVDNPAKNVRVTKRKQLFTFEVPVNHPDAHTMGFMDLLAAAELSGLLGLPTHLNKKSLLPKEIESVRVGNKVLHEVKIPLERKP
jgi:hypothetical protein